MSGISSGMWASVSGLQAYGTQLGNIGTNIANSGSIGYRGTTAYLAGGFGGQLSSLSGPESIAQGVSVSTVYTDYSSGIGVSSTSSTHVAISGSGMFGVRNPNSEEILYTRRGDFQFKEDGFLATSDGYRVQGWPIESNGVTIGGGGAASTAPESRIKGTGVPSDIRSPGDTSPPSHTTSMDIINNLGASDGTGKSSDAVNPYFAMMGKWDGTKNPPIGENAYSYQTTVKVFDEGGSTHEVTVYFDKVGEAKGPGEQWEFMVTMPPGSDKRVFGGTPVSSTANPVAGMLMAGTLSFSSGGQLENMTAFVPNQAPVVAPAVQLGPDDFNTTNAGNLANWVPAPLSQNGLPIFFPNFSGSTSSDANGFVSNTTNPINGIQLNLGLYNSSGSWNGLTNAGALVTAGPGANGMGSPKQNANCTTNYAGSSSTLYMNRDGNSFGLLQDIQVDNEGIISALYSNGTRIEFAQLSLYAFPDMQGLDYLNGSIYRGTRASGMGTPGAAGQGGRGALQNYQLEQSNVDLSIELTNMIVAQNSYTACTKTIQTSNQALAAVINMV